MTIEHIYQAIDKAIRTVAPTARGLDPSVPLTGQNGSLDSIGFLTFLITLEDELGGRINLAAILQDGVSQHDDGPFKTVGSLAAMIDARLNGH